tara:strand:+ start:7869 stop:9116 length:1248 start_codon:yes stop_codon:yes gene_type:complete
MGQEYKRDKDSSTIPCQVQKIYATPLHICVSIRVPGKTLWLWMGRKKPENRISLSEYTPPAKYRIKDVGVEWLRAKIKGKWLLSMPQVTLDNTIKLEAHGQKYSIEFGYRENRLHFIEIIGNDEKRTVSKSFKGSDDHFDSCGHENNNENPIEKLDHWIEKHKQSLNKKSLKKKNRKYKKIEKDIEKLSSYERMYEIAKNTEELKYKNEIVIDGHKIKLKKGLNEYQKADLIYAKAKRFKQAIVLQQDRLSALRNLSSNNIEQLELVFSAESLGWNLPQTKSVAEIKIDDKTGLSHEEFQLPGGYLIAVGLSARANDHLRKTWAKKDDLWVHIENQTGAHLFCKSNQLPDQKTWELIGSILKEYSKSTLDDVHLVWTKAKYLKPVKGAAGLVRFSNEKRILVRYLPTWRNMLSLR